jgi:hypothetical protein
VTADEPNRLSGVYDQLADRPAAPLHRSSRHRLARKALKVTPPPASRHAHAYDAAGFCTVCQEHRAYLEATPAEPLTPAELLAEPSRRGVEPTDDEWAAALLEAGPPDSEDAA